MTSRFTIACVVLLVWVAPRSAPADAFATVVFDTVDAVELRQTTGCLVASTCVHTRVLVTGIHHGESTPTTSFFDFGDKRDTAAHCQRLAMVAMAKPGKYLFAIGSDEQFNSANTGEGACKLTLVNP